MRKKCILIESIMITRNYCQSLITSHASINRLLVFFVFLFLSDFPILLSQKSPVSVNSYITGTDTSYVIYRNPLVYNVDYTFELCPDKDSIDPSKDLKLWIPVPREWDSQKAVKIISVNPPPQAEFEDPEHGNRILFWDFGKESEKSSYRVDIKFRLESYETHAEVDPEHIGQYDKSSKQYALYTRSSHTIAITPRITEMALEAIGDEKNPYRQAELIFRFVRTKVHYKLHRRERGVGTEVLLNFPLTDEMTGEEYYEGACGQQSAMFIALCRAVGIPARAVVGFVGWNPWIKEEDLGLFSPNELKLSPEGLAGTQHYLSIMPHNWAEFYLPGHGWIPVEVTGNGFGHSEMRLIMSKGFDVQIGPQSPDNESEGYGFQWVLLHNGTTDELQTGVWNIARIRKAKVTLLHHADPFPADGLRRYGETTFPNEDAENNLRRWRKGVLSWPSRLERSSITDNLNMAQSYRNEREAFVCHMLHKQLGDERFFKLVDTYVDLRQKMNQAVSPARFQKLAEEVNGETLDWFFNQWVNNTELQRLKLEKVTAEKDKKGWQIHGRLIQSGETTFRMPIEFAIDTKYGREIEKLNFNSKAVDFDLRTQNEPIKLMVDPDYKILKIQRMPPRLKWFLDVYPEYILIYGTLAEAESNKTTAEHFNDEYFGLGSEIIKADTNVIQEDLKGKCVILFGRPKTNKISQQFKDIFPIYFDEDKFIWQGVTYDQPTQGVAQIVKNPFDPGSEIVLCAGLSGDATQKFCRLYNYDEDASYVIIDQDKQLTSGDWDDYNSDLVWNFK
jgi:transglutaminase-like putative cysteine protease